MNVKALILPVLLGTLAACASTRASSFAGPKEAAVAILGALDEGRPDDANRIYGLFTASPERERSLYPVLYQAAQDRFETGQPGEAAAVLDLLVFRHPTAVGSREALVYSLFLERARAGSSSPDLEDRLEAAIAGVRASSPRVEPRVELAETQLRIDQGRLDEARDAFTRFLGTWDGEPGDLMPYAEDLNRYLQSH